MIRCISQLSNKAKQLKKVSLQRGRSYLAPSFSPQLYGSAVFVGFVARQDVMVEPSMRPLFHI